MKRTRRRKFSVAISEKQMMKHRFHIGDEIRGTAWTKMYPKLEYADYYRAGSMKKLHEGSEPDEEAREPWVGEGWLDDICTENREDEE